MVVAKNITALAAMVTAGEVREVPLAGRVIAHSRLVVRLPVFPSGRASRLGELLEIPLVVDALPTVARRPPAQTAQCTQAAYEAAVGAQVALLGTLFILWLHLPGKRCLGREFSRTQHSGHVHRADRAAETEGFGRRWRSIAGGAERGDLRLFVALVRCRNGRRLRECGLLVEVLGRCLLELLLVPEVDGMLLVWCAGHYEVGSHGGRFIACFYRFESRAGLALWQGRKRRVGAWRADGGEGRRWGSGLGTMLSSEDKQLKLKASPKTKQKPKSRLRQLLETTRLERREG